MPPFWDTSIDGALSFYIPNTLPVAALLSLWSALEWANGDFDYDKQKVKMAVAVSNRMLKVQKKE